MNCFSKVEGDRCIIDYHLSLNEIAILENLPYNIEKCCISHIDKVKYVTKEFFSLRELSTTLAEGGYMRESNRIAYLIPDSRLSSLALSSENFFLFKNGNFEEILDSSPLITDKWKSIEILENLSKLFYTNGYIDKSLNAARLIHDDSIKFSVLINISQKLMIKGHIDRAIDVLNLITDENQKYYGSTCLHQILYEEFFKMHALKNVFTENLKEEDNLRKKMNTIFNKTHLIHSKNLFKIKHKINCLKARFIKILKDLNECDLFRLEKLLQTSIKPFFLDNVLYLVKTYKKLEQASKILNENIFQEICAEFDELEIFQSMHANNVPQFPAFNQTFSQSIKDNKGFQSIRDIDESYNLVKKLMYQGEIHEAIKVAESITFATPRIYSYNNIAYELVTKGKILKFFEFIESISSSTEKEIVSYAILVAVSSYHSAISSVIYKDQTINRNQKNAFFAVLKNLETLKNLIKMSKITDNETSSVLNDLSHLLIKNKRIDEAIFIANLIQVNEIKTSIFLEISKMLMQNDNLIKSLDVARMISSDIQKSYALQYISNALIENGKAHLALNVAYSIPDNTIKFFTFRNIFYGTGIKFFKTRYSMKYSDKTKDLETIEVQRKIFFNFDVAAAANHLEIKNSKKLKELSEVKKLKKSYALRDLSNTLSASYRIDEAITFTNLIPNVYVKCYCFQDISYWLLDKGNVDKAVNIAELITDELIRNITLQHIKDQKINE